MIELFASIGFVGVIMLLVGFVAVFWLAKLIDDKSDDDWGQDE